MLADTPEPAVVKGGQTIEGRQAQTPSEQVDVYGLQG